MLLNKTCVFHICGLATYVLPCNSWLINLSWFSYFYYNLNVTSIFFKYRKWSQYNALVHKRVRKVTIVH